MENNEWTEELEIPKCFSDWWNTDIEDNAKNPFSKETPIYWALEGWKAATKSIVTTKNQEGQIVAVTRQNDEGVILEVIATND